MVVELTSKQSEQAPLGILAAFGQPYRAAADVGILHSGLWSGGTRRIGIAYACGASSIPGRTTIATSLETKRFGLTRPLSQPHLRVPPETHRTLTGHSPDTHRTLTVTALLHVLA